MHRGLELFLIPRGISGDLQLRREHLGFPNYREKIIFFLAAWESFMQDVDVDKDEN
jgi:hypothetical protein